VLPMNKKVKALQRGPQREVFRTLYGGDMPDDLEQIILGVDLASGEDYTTIAFVHDELETYLEDKTIRRKTAMTALRAAYGTNLQTECCACHVELPREKLVAFTESPKHTSVMYCHYCFRRGAAPTEKVEKTDGSENHPIHWPSQWSNACDDT
jgi:hypothetical protein